MEHKHSLSICTRNRKYVSTRSGWLIYVVCFQRLDCRLLGRDGREQNHNNRRHGHITQIVPNSSSPFTHFLAAVGGQVEHEHGEKGDAHAGYYEVDSVEERLAPHRDVESNIEVGLGAACVIPETRRSKSVTYSTPTPNRSQSR